MTECDQQGTKDPMCGLYCIYNFLKICVGLEGSSKGAFYEVLRACQSFDLLTADLLTHGYEDFQLKAVIDRLITEWRLEFESFYLNDVLKSITGSFWETAKQISDAGGAIISYSISKDHWVLVTNSNNELSILNSAQLNSVGRVNNAKFSEEYGIVILKKTRIVPAIAI